MLLLAYCSVTKLCLVLYHPIAFSSPALPVLHHLPEFAQIPCGSAGKESACNEGDLGSIPRLGRSPGEGKGYPLQYSSLENSIDYIDHGVAKSLTRLSDFHFHTFTGTARAVSNAPSALELNGNKLKLVFHGVGGEEGRQ